MRKIGNWILNGLTIEISIKPAEGVYDANLGWIWMVYICIRIIAGLLHLIVDLIK